ncbi:uncharacterized protein LOC103044012 [Astyanax mexicanus]|uniref:uncharacterized protein LOC103044012 n=1 Tax=Astyanax mexicanus TaxID=7994 RepID=UPI0020CB4EB9|nr:uncharacterized protein LOC103044012 [Astyanax mexicanus]
MVNACCVIKCHNRSHDRRGKRISNGVRFFSFPAWKQHGGSQLAELTKRRRIAWVAAVRRKNITFSSISRHMFVCSRHFHTGKPAYEYLECHPDWVPSLHLGHTEVKATHTERFSRRTKRQQAVTGDNTVPSVPPDLVGLTKMDETPGVDAKRPEVDEAAPGSEVDEAAPGSEVDEVASKDNAEGQLECGFCSHRNDEINRLLEENRKLKEELSRKKMDEQFFHDDVMVRYYTGLPCFAVLKGVLTQLLPCLPQTGRKLSQFQMLILTLMRLRLNLPIQHIAHLFCIDRKKVSTTFRDTIGVMFTHLSPLVHWPERHCLQGSMPHQFVEAFGNRIAVIVDCFEINIERASNLKARAQTFSHYKHKHTLKYLIGITPQGAVSFISKGWGGRASDKHVTENSGLLQKLLPGDLVLADRGFDIRDIVGLMCAEVKIPTFTRGRCQLDAKDVEETRKIAHLRVHVERVIGCVRTKYTILSGNIPLSMVLPCEGEDMVLLDKVVSVCCALTNMCPSVVLKP